MRPYYLAVDIGASGGRHILGSLDGGRLVTEEVYRFPNGAVTRGGRLCWDFDRLFGEVLAGMRRCAELGRIPAAMGIDTWGVDFVLLDKNGRVLGDTVAYRDGRTAGAPAEVGKILGDAELYARTGIQKQPFNTIYQLWTVRETLKDAESLLMAPEYLNFLLTGVKRSEYTNATTTGLLNAADKTWDRDILSALGYPRGLFGALYMPGEPVGDLLPWVAERVGFNCRVLLPATHDTGSAVAAIPVAEDAVYISSGTWSLMGVENLSPILTEESRLLNFTNEGGAEGRFRYLKNIMGLWMIQELHRELPGKCGFAELAAMAEGEALFGSVVDPERGRYLAPRSMAEAIRAECRDTGQRIPETPGQLARCVFLSLAKNYAKTAGALSRLCGRRFTRINIVGGGCQNGWLNRLTAGETGLPVLAGPVEASALGNLAVQMIADGLFRDLSAARAAISKSFNIREVRP